MEFIACSIDLENGDSKSLGLGFADDFLLFGRAKFVANSHGRNSDEELAYAGLCFNTGNIKF